MDDNLTALIMILAIFIGLPFLGVVSYLILVPFNRLNRYRQKANLLKLKTLEQQADLDLRLREWQHTKSLEDLERHRQRLERDLDNLHSDDD